MEWNEKDVCYVGKVAEKLVAVVQTGASGKGRAGDLSGGERSKLSPADQVDCGFIRIGSINCSAFGGLKRCVNSTM